jgi:hypothetical protein
MKLTTARQAVAVASEVLEAFGGAGYVEDTGLPVLLRDAQVLSIWEGTTNVLALDALRAAGGESLKCLRRELEACAREARDARLAPAAAAALGAFEHAESWLARAGAEGAPAVESGARRFAMTLGRAHALALLTRHAQWSLTHERDPRASAAARRFAANGIDLIADADAEDAFLLMNDN